MLYDGWQVVAEVQVRGSVSHRQEITNLLWALAALDQLQPQHFASLTAMLDEDAVLENMSQSGARQLSQVAASVSFSCQCRLHVAMCWPTFQCAFIFLLHTSSHLGCRNNCTGSSVLTNLCCIPTSSCDSWAGGHGGTVEGGSS